MAKGGLFSPKNTPWIIAIAVIVGVFFLMQPSAVSPLSAAEEVGVPSIIQTQEVVDYTGQAMKFKVEAKDGAGTAVNPTAYVYLDSKLNAETLQYWGDERSFSDDAGNYYRTASFSAGSYTTGLEYTAGDCIHWHYALSGYEDSFGSTCLPTSGSDPLNTLQSTGVQLAGVELAAYDTTAFAAAAVDLGVSTTETGRVYKEQVTQTVATAKVNHLNHLRIDDINTTEGVQRVEVKITAPNGVVQKLIYDANAAIDETENSRGYYDSDYDTTSFKEDLKKLRAEAGEQVTVEFIVKANVDSGAATAADSLLQNNEVAIDSVYLYNSENTEIFGNQNVVG